MAKIDLKTHTRKNGRLHIYIRKDKYKGKYKSLFYVGRTYIQGKQIVKSSGELKLKNAISVLEKWYDELVFKKKHNIKIHQTSIKDSIESFLKDNDSNTSITGVTRKWYKDRWNYISKNKDFMKLNVQTLDAMDVQKVYIKWRMDRAKSQGKVLRGKTLEGDLMAISGFLSWCYKKKLRTEKLENIKRILSKEIRTQRTSRSLFSKEEYNHLLKVSRSRIKSGRTLRIRFNRERLHQFIVFMVGTGLRVDECLKLHWEDVIFMDRMKNRKNITGEIDLDDHSRYWLKIYVRESKTKQRECVSVSSSYFALQRLMKLYKETGLQKLSGEIWGVKSFREGLNELLEDAKLKTENRGGTILKRDSKSFRNTFIQFMLDKGINSTVIAKNCGTSTQMIDKYYIANSSMESMLDVWLQTGRSKLKVIKNAS